MPFNDPMPGAGDLIPVPQLPHLSDGDANSTDLLASWGGLNGLLSSRAPRAWHR